jgi:lipopolysaccharide export system permease protein
MRRIDWLITRRLGSRIAMVVLVFYGLIALVESLDAWRFNYLTSVGGLPLALLAIIGNAARWTIKTLSVTVLLGAIIGILDLQARREMTVIKSAGISIWRIMVGPTLAVVIASLFISFVAETVVTQINRSVFPSPLTNNGGLNSGELWLEQGAEGERYVLMAKAVSTGNASIADVVVFFRDTPKGIRITAPAGTLENGAWKFPQAIRFSADEPAQYLSDYTLPTTMTAADLSLKYSPTEDLTLFELGAALAGNLSDPALRAAVLTRYARLVSLPLLLVGSLFIAFAFTAGYRRTNKYGVTVLYGIVLGFVVFVITEMADRAGASGVLDPVFAAWAPAFIAIVIGLTVLLRKEDGRA